MKHQLIIERDDRCESNPWRFRAAAGGRERRGRRATEADARVAAAAALAELRSKSSRVRPSSTKPRTHVAFDPERVEEWRYWARECGVPLVQWLTNLAEQEREALEKSR
jgi:hypothetical protein